MADPSKTLFDDSDSPVVIDLETALETASVPVIDPRKSTMPPLPPRKIEPKKRKVEKKAVVSVESATDSEANGVASDATAATPAKSAVKRVRKPAAKKTAATTEGSVEISTDAAEGDDVSEPMDVAEGGEGVESVVESTKKTSSGSTKKPRPPAKRGLAALKALESYNNSGGKEAMQEKRVVATVNYSDDSGILAAVDSLFKKDKASNSSSACSDVEVDAVEKAAEVVIKEYSPEIVAKIAANREKIHALVSELLQWEGASDMADQNLDLSLAVDDLVRFVTNTAVATPAVPVSTSAVADSAAVENSASTEAPVAAESTGESEAATSPATPSAAAPAVTVAAVVSEEEDVADTLFKLIRVINARCIQGSHLTKTELSQLVSLTLAGAVEKINIACEEISHIDGENVLSADLNEISDAAVRVVVDRQQRVLSAIQHLNTPAALLIEISVVATRKHFGNPANKPHASLEGEDVNDAAVWRWVVNYNHLFTKAGQAVLREVGAVRARYSKTIKSFAKVVDDLMNESCSASALAVSEERAAKNMVEVEKAKEKRRELEVKRAADALERANKEAIKEQKRREKEENDLKKKLAAEAKAEAAAAAKEAAALAKANAPHVEKEKKVHVPTEKELKEALLLEKQKNAMKGFFFASKPAAASSTSSSSANSAVKPQQQSSHSNSSSSSSSTTAAASDSCAIDLTGSSNSVPMVVDLEVAKSPRLVAFEAAMSANMSMSEVLTAHRVRAQETRKVGKKGSRKPRKPLKLFVNVNLPNPAGAFGDDANNYTELRERTVDSRMRTLLFSEDHRPAYVGTFSKKSLIVSGRRPTARDEEMLSYDYDSEAEWEEEVEGEDIGDSGDEDEEDGGAANELMYDDFFRRDNDYGSDAESDVEGGLNTAAAISIREREEVVGPRFVTSSHIVTYPLSAGAATPKNVVKAYRAEINRNDCNSSSSSRSPNGVSFIVCGDRDADVQRLSQYAAVAFAPTHLMPYLGDARNQPQTTVSSSEGAKKEAGSATKSKKKKTAAASAGTDSSEAGAVTASTPTVAAAATEGEVAEGEGKTVFIKGFDETKLPALITAVHGKKEGIDKLVAAFQLEQPHMSKVQIKKRIMEVADKSKHAEGHGTLRWMVKPEFFEKAGVESPEPLEFTPLKKKKRIEPTKVSGPVSTSSVVSSSSSLATASVSSFISAFMPAAVAQSPSATDAEPAVAPAGVQQAQSAAALSAAIPSTPVKSAQKSITAFVTLTSPSKNMPTSSGSSSTSNSISVSSGLFGSTVKSTPVKRALNSSSSSSASKSTVGSSNKKARKSPSAAAAKETATAVTTPSTSAVPVVVDLLEDEAVEITVEAE